MKRSVWLIGVLVCAGCVQPPPAPPPKPFAFESGRTPYSAAICIARNARNLANITAEERILGDSAWEVIVRAGAETLAMAEAHNRGTGSLVTLRVTRDYRGNPADFARRLLSDCQAQPVER